MELRKKIQKAIWMGAIFLLLLVVSCSFLLFKNKPSQEIGEASSFSSQANSLMASPTGRNFAGLTIGATTHTVGCTDAVKTVSVPATNWMDGFWNATDNRAMNSSELYALDAAQGNFYKKNNDNGRDGSSAAAAYVISNATELAFLGAVFTARGTGAEYASLPLDGKFFELDSDINLEGNAWTPLVNLTNYRATTIHFDGKEHKIMKAIVDQRVVNVQTTSIFGYFPQGNISNLIIEDACIRGNTRAAIVASTNSATSLTNILVKNSYVSSNQNTAGIIYNSGNSDNTITDCRIEDCEVETLGFNTINTGYTLSVMGIARSNNIAFSDSLKGTDIVKNSKIHVSQTLNNYDPLTGGRNQTINVYGIGCSMSNNNADIGNFNLTGNEVVADIKVKDSNANASNSYNVSYNVNTYGGYHYSSGAQNLVKIHDITMDNCFVKADFSYNPTDETKNGNMTFQGNCNVVGIARLNNTRTNVTHFENLLVKNCDVTSNVDVQPIVAPSGTTQRTFYSYLYAQGVFYSDNSSSVINKAENCNIENSNVVAKAYFKNNTDQSGASFSSTVVLNGVGGSSDMNVRTDYVNCSSKNCKFDAIIEEDFKTENDPSNTVRNTFSNNIYLAGIGRGQFLQDEDSNPCYVKNVEFNAKSNVTRGENDSVSNCSSTLRAVGVGFNVSNHPGSFDKTKIENSTFNIEGKYGTSNKVGSSYVSAMGYSQSSGYNASAVSYKDVQTKNVVINAVGNYNYIAGQAYASKACNGIVSVQNSLVEDVEINSTSTNGSYITGVLYNTSSNAGIMVDNVVVNNVSFIANAGSTTSATANVSGVANIAGTSNMSTLKNTTVKDCNISANATGAYAYASGLVYCTTPVTLQNNTVEKCDIEAITKTYDAFAAGMALQTSSTNGLNSKIENCYAVGNDVLAEFKTGGTASSRTVGAYGIAGYYMKSVDSCVVTDGTVTAKNAVGYAYAEGIAGTWGASHFTNRPNNSTSEPLTSIKNSYNFAEVKAITDGTSSTGASGIGQAEYIDSCVNYGKVMGNYVGGITRGFYQGTNSSSTAYSSPLIVKNSTNAADVCRADTGGTSYIGGIVGVYYMNSLANVNFVLENNASMGGVYSKQQLDGTYLQNLSPSTYLGTLYGHLRVRTGVSTSEMYPTRSDNYLTALSKYSIKNNYSLVEENGFNGGLYKAPTGEILNYTKNSPTTNYMASSDGVYYDGVYVNGGYDYVLKDLYTFGATITANTNSNKNISSGYTDSTFAIDSSIAEANGWKQMSLNGNVYPQVAIELAKQVIVFNLNGYDGTNPGVIVANINSEDKFSFTAPDVDLTQTGVSLAGWKWEFDTDTFAANAPVEKQKHDYLVTFYAQATLTNYIIDFDGDVTGDGVVEKVVTLESTNISLTATYGEHDTITAITWQVEKKDGSGYVNIAFNQTSGTYGTEDTLSLNGIFNSDFLRDYAKDNTNKIKIKVEYSTIAVWRIDFENVVGGSSEYAWSATVNGTSVASGNTASVLNDSTIEISVTPNNRHYEFVGYLVDDAVVAHNTSDNTYTYTISHVTADHNVKINVRKVAYSLDINVVNIQNVSLPVDSATMANLVVPNTYTISVGGKLPQLQANTNYAGYRFIGWKLLGMSEDESIATTNGKIDDNYYVGAEDFDRYVIGNKFNVIAVFQRQYHLNITMTNPTGDSFLSTYVVNYVDENGVEQNLTNVTENEEETIIESMGSYIIDENTFVKIYVKPNKRVKVLDPVGVEFGGNTAYVYLTQEQNIEFVFEVRPLSVETKTMNVTEVESFDGRIETSLSGATDYFVDDGTDVSQNPGFVNINNTLTLSYNAAMLQNLSYRFIDVYLYNVANDSYEKIENNEITVDDSFFDKFVTEDGNVLIMLKVIKQYKVIITGENLVSEDAYVLGKYEVIVKDGDTVLDNTSVRYAEIEKDEKDVSYILDTGLRVVIKPTVLSDYANFAGYSGIFEGELNSENSDANALVDSDRAISLRFAKNTYNIETKFNAAVGGKLATTQTFQLGDTIVISYTPENNYQILDWKLAGKKLADWKATKVGNTVKIVASEEFLGALKELNLFDADKITLQNDLETMMSPSLFYGLIVGGIVIVLLAGLITFLLIRQSKLKKAKLEQERKLNDIARKFNIAGMISDLKAGKDLDVFSNTNKKQK